ncbi:hypothetical protein [Edwardsiella tarda]|uniref:hypothetical protein n=1 Tax=Edwardsiella tarda TaxID=636 RepID=UPI00083A6B0E|nr:hypothetical protein [Edwardsiella tarda]
MSTRRLKHVDGLQELDKLLDGLTDPKFRARALRVAAKATMAPVEQTLKSKLPSGGSDQSSYKHYGIDGYNPGDLRNATKITVRVNSNKEIKQDRTGSIKKNQRNELYAAVGFKPKYVKLASILEHGRSRRIATTEDGKVFHFFGHRTDATERDIGTTEPRNFVSETAVECEAKMVADFRTSLEASIAREVKRQSKPPRKRPKR